MGERKGETLRIITRSGRSRESRTRSACCMRRPFDSGLDRGVGPLENFRRGSRISARARRFEVPIYFVEGLVELSPAVEGPIAERPSAASHKCEFHGTQGMPIRLGLGPQAGSAFTFRTRLENSSGRVFPGFEIPPFLIPKCEFQPQTLIYPQTCSRSTLRWEGPIAERPAYASQYCVFLSRRRRSFESGLDRQGFLRLL
ncbi:hypothetical protein DFH09DRAFT_1093877 [Mycena vulgaris]|nr:hypothetical protein DFH09DRAFT_1093877 [Mycena vulgaris]